MDLIASRRNPRVREVRSLENRKGRDRTGLFLIEGLRAIGEALAAGAPLAYLLVAPDLFQSQFVQKILTAAREANIPVYEVTPQIFEGIASRDHAQGVLGVARQRWWTLDDLDPASHPRLVALVAPQDPGNLGAILRSMDAVGASGLVLLDGGVDPFHPTAVRASMGTLFWLPVIQASFVPFIQWARSSAYTVYGSSARAGAPFESVDYQRPHVLLLGSEQSGLSSQQAEICDYLISIPMLGRATSLNLAVAAGVLLYAMRPRG